MELILIILKFLVLCAIFSFDKNIKPGMFVSFICLQVCKLYFKSVIIADVREADYAVLFNGRVYRNSLLTERLHVLQLFLDKNDPFFNNFEHSF